MKEARRKKTHIVSFHLYEVLQQEKWVYVKEIWLVAYEGGVTGKGKEGSFCDDGNVHLEKDKGSTDICNHQNEFVHERNVHLMEYILFFNKNIKVKIKS